MTTRAPPATKRPAPSARDPAFFSMMHFDIFASPARNKPIPKASAGPCMHDGGPKLLLTWLASIVTLVPNPA